MKQVAKKEIGDEKELNQAIYEETFCDYKFDAPVEDIDILRILRENRDTGEEYVIIMNDGFFIGFFSKKFAKRILKHNLVDISPIQEKEFYGFIDPDTQKTNSIIGQQIRSVGYTFGMIARNNRLEDTLFGINSLPKVEIEANMLAEAKRIDRKNDTRQRREVKVIAGK